MFRIRLLSPFRTEFQISNYLFSRDIALNTADALLCEWSPQDELLNFGGPKALYNSEAVARNMFNQPKWEQIKSNQDEQTFLYHAHPDPFYRVPMIAYVEPLLTLHSDERVERGVAVISNSGVSWSTPDILRRNELATNSLVDLYGKEENWRKFIQKYFPSSTTPLPENYRGEVSPPWNSYSKYHTMAQYKVAISLENLTEPYYFTEKFYAAVQAGCIPVYHAHPSVKEGILQGTMYVDPANFDFDAERTLYFALAEDRKQYADRNFEWLESNRAQAAGERQIFLRLGKILTRYL